MPAKEYSCEVRFFRLITPTVFEVGFETSETADFEAGQFFSIVVPGAGPKGRDLRRAYSIASPPELRPIELCVKLVEGGPGTNYLYGLRPGDKMRAFAPYGDFTYVTQAGRHAFFIATGTGIAPYRSMVQSRHFQENRPLSATCLLGVREEDELLYEEDFLRAGSKWVGAVSRPRSDSFNGFRGRVTDYFREHQASIPWKDSDFYLCGNSAMIDEMKAILAQNGVEKSAIHQEIYYRVAKEANTTASEPSAST